MTTVRAQLSRQLLTALLSLPPGWRVLGADTPADPRRVCLIIGNDHHSDAVFETVVDAPGPREPARRLAIEALWEEIVLRAIDQPVNDLAALSHDDPFADRSNAPLPTLAEAIQAAEAAFAPRVAAAARELAAAAAQRPAPTRASDVAESVPAYGESLLASLRSTQEQVEQMRDAAIRQALERAPFRDPDPPPRRSPQTGRPLRPGHRRHIVPIIDVTPPPVVNEFGEFRVLDIAAEPVEEIKPTPEEPFEEPQIPGHLVPAQVDASSAMVRARIAACRQLLGERLDDPDLPEVLQFLANLQPDQYAEAMQRFAIANPAMLMTFILAARQIRDEMSISPLTPADVRASYGLVEGALGSGQLMTPRPAVPQDTFSHYVPGVYQLWHQPQLHEARTGIFSVAEVAAAAQGVVQRGPGGVDTIVSLLAPGTLPPDLELLNRVRRDESAQASDVQCRWCRHIRMWDGVNPYCTGCGGSL